MARAELKLRDAAAGATTWYRVLDDGTVEIEQYEFGEDAQRWFGNDVAYTYRVAPEAKAVFLRLLGERAGTEILNDANLVLALAAQFPNGFVLKKWMESNGVEFTSEFDSWA